MLCFSIKLAVTFASEAEPQLFLACSQFLGKFEPRCSYKIVQFFKKKMRVLYNKYDIFTNVFTSIYNNCLFQVFSYNFFFQIVDKSLHPVSSLHNSKYVFIMTFEAASYKLLEKFSVAATN